MRKEQYPVSHCKVCDNPFQSRPIRRRGGAVVWSAHCGWDCAMVTARAKTRESLERGRATRNKNLAMRRMKKLEDEFGLLTAREHALVVKADKRGYDRGYAAAYAPMRAKKGAA